MIYNISEIRVGASNISSGYVGGNIVWPNAPAGNPIIAYFTDISGNRYPAKNPDGYPNPNELSSDTLASLPTGHTWYQLDTTSACTSIASDWSAESVNKTIAVVNLAQGLQEIHQGAFGDFWYLTGITIPEGVYYVGGGAFEGCSGLTSVMLPNSLRTLSDRTFVGCQNLSAVTMPNALADIGGHVFADCTSLSSITIPNTVVQIGHDVGEEEGDDGYTFANCALTSVTIPASVQSIAEYSFGNLRNIQWIEFKGTTPPQHGDNVFYNIEDIIQERGENIPIYVPCSALNAYKEQWSEYATLFECKETPFDGFVRLTLTDGTIIDIPGEGELTSSEISPYVEQYHTDPVYGRKQIIKLVKKVECGEACTSVNYSFGRSPQFTDRYPYLTDVIISSSVQSLCYDAFSNSSITAITGSEYPTKYGGAESQCFARVNMQEIKISPQYDTVDSDGFFACMVSGCTNLTAVTIPSGVTRIHGEAFDGVTNLQKVTVMCPTPPTDYAGYTFTNNVLRNSNVQIYVPAEYLNNYLNASGGYWPTPVRENRIHPIP